MSYCSRCGHRFADFPIEVDALYGHDYAGFRVDETFEANVRRFLTDELAEGLPARPRLLDVGCGNGAVLATAGALGWDATGIDASQAAVDACRARGLRADVGDFPTHRFDADARFDVITFWDVLEHLIEPRLFVERASRLLAPRGRVVIKVPGHGATTLAVAATVPRLAGSLVQVPAHLQFFSRASLARLLADDFGELRWVESRGMRAPSTGGSLKRRFGRRVVQTIQRISGDAPLLVVARGR